MDHSKIRNKEGIKISSDTLQDWQILLTMIALKLEVPAALVMKVDLPDIKVFLSSHSEGNPYERGASEHLPGSGLYCERVLITKKKLLVPDALKDKEWDRNPDIKLGMTFYLGVPVLWPDKEAFGTVCILDRKERSDTEEGEALLECFKRYVESCLDLHVSQYLKEDAAIISEKNTRCDDLRREVEEWLKLGK